jgi:hypothetical protein
MICANQECGIEFEAKTHNQKYHSDECCRVATNKKIMEKYYEKKAIRSGSTRLCKNCNSQLSRYNDQKICSMCQKNYNAKNKSKIIEMLDDIS